MFAELNVIKMEKDITNAFFKTSLHVLKDVFDILSTYDRVSEPLHAHI